MASNDDDQISYICGITQCTPQQAAFYLDASHGNAEGAVNMFYGGSDLPELDVDVLISLLS